MSDGDSDYDEEAHQKLLKSIQAITRKGTQRRSILVKRKLKKVTANELIGAIHSTRNVDDVKKEVQKKKKTGKKGETMKLSTPLHRLAAERIQSSIAYTEARKDLAVWAPVVQEYRLADHLVFPMENEEFTGQSGVQTLENLRPRTPLELKMANILGTSKNNLHNEQCYTAAEMELLKAMSLKEAKAKCAQLQKMRALVSYREAKLRRQAKIKSKSYHRHLKRQKRKQLIKEFDELLTKDPEAAKEKLVEIERQRILERATLKHRNGSKQIQMLARHAAKDKNAKRALEEQIRLGRELVEKHGIGSDSDSDIDSSKQSDAAGAIKPQQLLERAAEIAAREETFETSESNPALKISLRRLRQEQKISSEKSATKAQQALKEPQNVCNNVDVGQEVEAINEKIWEEDMTWDMGQSVVTPSQEIVQENMDTSHHRDHIREHSVERLCKRKSQTSGNKKKKKKKTTNETPANVDELFAVAEQRLIESATKEAELIRLTEKNDTEAVNASNTTNDRNKADGVVEGDLDDVGAAQSTIAVEAVKKKEAEDEQRVPEEVDISLDPRHFLKAETSVITQLSADLMDKVDDFDAEVEQGALAAAAFEDDDVIGDFEAEKAATEEREKPKDLDLNLQGWGSWAGPGIAPKKKKRFVIKAKEKRRKDRDRRGLIISETVDSSIDKVQPRSDFEAVVRQPLGKEWNPQRIHQKLVTPTVLTRAGRIIKPLDKEVALKEHVKEVSDEEN